MTLKFSMKDLEERFILVNMIPTVEVCNIPVLDGAWVGLPKKELYRKEDGE